jgi:O-antigen/teichoic acid export membrane protein
MLSAKSSVFIKQAAKLASGTAFAQIINIVSLPVLTRIYSPNDFGIFAIFLASVAILTSVSTLKYETAILDASNHELAKHCTMLTVVSCIVVLLPLFIISGSSYIFEFSFFGLDLIMMVCLALAIIITNVFTSLYYWCNRTEQYNYMTKGRIYAAFSAALVSILFGLTSIKSVNGLVAGSLVGMLFNALYLFYKLKISFKSIREIPLNDLFKLSINLKRFPLYLVPSTLLDRLAAQVHIFVFSSVFGSAVAGSMGVYNRVIGLPVSIIGNSIGDVFKRKASELLRQGKSCRELFLKTAVTLFTIGFPVSLTLFFFAPTIFVFVLGDEWLQAGDIASFLALNFLFAFVVSPLSGLLYLEKNQKYDLAIQILLISTLGAGMYYAVAKSSLEIALYSYAFSFILKYLIQFIIGYKLAK